MLWRRESPSSVGGRERWIIRKVLSSHNKLTPELADEIFFNLFNDFNYPIWSLSSLFLSSYSSQTILYLGLSFLYFSSYSFQFHVLLFYFLCRSHGCRLVCELCLSYGELTKISDDVAAQHLSLAGFSRYMKSRKWSFKTSKSSFATLTFLPLSLFIFSLSYFHLNLEKMVKWMMN